MWDVQNALRSLRVMHPVDALWVLNDDRLSRDGRERRQPRC